ncbi:MAG: TrkA family potassium uptake protein [Spirochaetales bacterium]|nr:TrkA family potassium uptake protein [Spirochaetales bacterium]
MRKSFAVLGMGKFGQSICVELSKMGAEVLAVDQDEDLVDQVKDQVERAAVADLCDPESIKKLGIADMDTVIVTMSTSMEASILCCMVSKEAGVRHVVAKAKDHLMGQILQRVGADEVIYPEEESAKRNAFRLISPDIRDFFNIQDVLSLVEIVPKPAWIGHNLIELNLRRKFGMNVIGVKINGKDIENPDPERNIEATDTLMVIMKTSDVSNVI